MGRLLQDCVFLSTHNSYAIGPVGPLARQLDSGVRCVELDVHSTGNAFLVGHVAPGAEVALGGGNPTSLWLADWVAVVAGWHASHRGCALLTIILDLKEPLTPAAVDACERLLAASFGDALVRTDEQQGMALRDEDDWKGRVLAIASGELPVRQSISAATRFLVIEEQRGDPLQSFACAASAADMGWLLSVRAERTCLTRAWQFDEQHSHMPPPTWPATDTPYDAWYANAFAGVATT